MRHNATKLTFRQIGNLQVGTKVEAWMNEDKMMFLKFAFCLVVFLFTIVESKGQSMTFAENDINQTLAGVSVTGNMLTNDFDPFNETQWVKSVSCFNGSISQGSGFVGGRPFAIYTIHGVLAGFITININGSYEFYPVFTFTGKVSLNYVVENTSGATAAATLAIQVIPMDDPNLNNLPIAHDDTNTTGRDMNVTGNVITSNDYDLENDDLIIRAIFVDLNGDGLRAEPLNVGTEGIVYGEDVFGYPMLAGMITLNIDGSYNFDPIAEFYGKLSITYKVTDGTGAAEANLTILVLPDAGNQIIANDETIIANMNMPQYGNMLTNDYGIESDFQIIVEAKNNRGISLTIDGTTENELRSSGSLIMDADGSFTYSPNGGFIGTETITYVVCDDTGSEAICDTATLYLTTIPLNGLIDSRIVADINTGNRGNAHNGHSEKSSGIENNILGKTTEIMEEFSLYPNPATVGNGFINLSFKSITDRAQIQITDINGRIVRRLVADANAKEVNSLQIDVADLTEGRYHLQLIDGTNAHSEIFILMNNN